MDAPDNSLDDFPPETFTVLAFCGACGSRETDLRILYTGAGGFRYRREETDGPTGS